MALSPRTVAAAQAAVYVPTGLRWTYLLDAVVEAGLVAAWVKAARAPTAQ